MIVLHTVADFRAWRQRLPSASLTPFVPTMGALHDGHASLVRIARQMAGPQGGGAVLASIFVNPTQFGPHEDFNKYPRTLEADCALLEKAGCDAVFVPSAAEMYGDHLASPTANTGVTVDPGTLGTVLEGAIRPGHFKGVCTVVAKLLGIVQPSHLLLGRKDFQQQVILRRMVADLNMPVEVVTCPTLRQPDGLALSSRNRYLNDEERHRALAIFQALCWAKTAYDQGERQAAVLDKVMAQMLLDRGLTPQYALVADPLTLTPWRDAGGRITNGGVLLIAAKLGLTRLIDNMML